MFNGRLWVTKGSGKMEGINSINVSPFNKFCNRMSKIIGSTCYKCYARALAVMYKRLLAYCIGNQKVLNRVLEDKELPRFFNDKIMRFNSYGAIVTVNQMRNYLTICYNNPEVTFGLWFKNHPIVWKVLKEMDKPDNLILNYSTFMVDPEDITVPKRVAPYVDRVFNVYKDKTEGIDFNCHGQCKDCLICYSRNDVKVVNERQKKNSRHIQ